MKTLSTTLFSVVLIVAVSGCRPPPLVPIHDISIGAVNPGERYYLVVAGDTLYRIALLHDLDMNTLAHMNKIGPPYGINVGQRLVIAPVPKNVPKPPTTAASPAAAPISTPVAKPAPVPRRAIPQPATISIEPPPADSAAPAIRPHISMAKTPPMKVRNGWQWPVAAKPTREFTRETEGIDYVLSPGTEIAAVANGTVIYAGLGLGGFENLVIVKQIGDYISAYSFNAPMEVFQGAEISRGTRIARINAGSETKRKFHFEVRLSGSPLNPRQVLPTQ